MYALIENKPEGIYTVSLIGWPEMQAQGATETEALNQLRQLLTAQLRRARIVQFDVGVPAEDNPWLQLGDAFKDNPLLDEVTQSIATDRHERNAVEDGV